ncbi:DNA-processing protein DprA [Actinotalea subterranea]|uniref:DNA-processing protein DprA n=1 Tax=Actinotalea subterranea TaxID=2607497 RepID=UPI001FEA44A4|nr:DNA-processing protein DprA [Actinotalea subterranea]
MTGGSSPDQATLLARAAWSRMVEPGDAVAGALVATLGPVDALAWARHTAQGPAALGGVPVPEELRGMTGATSARLARAAARWAPRLSELDPRRELRSVERLGGHLLVPEDPAWPVALDDLGLTAPLCLWVRGSAPVEQVLARAVAVIGARACTAYGEHVTAQMCAEAVREGWTVVSGGAYGIDAVAHRVALAVEGRTVAFLAGGVDRLYPAGNARLLEAVLAGGGLVVSEVPPGSVPSRTRFLQRNRLIAAVGRATLVVEAAWRSGALNTAGHAAALLRPVGAVPGPVTSASSAGCHRLLREGAAVCVTDGPELLELLGASGDHVPEADGGPVLPQDGLSPDQRRLLDALPLRRPADPESLARAAGLAVPEVLSALGGLELRGLAVRQEGRWRRGTPGGTRHG